MSNIKEKTGSFSLGGTSIKNNPYEDSYGNKYTNHAVTGMNPSGCRYSKKGGSGSGVIFYTDSRGLPCDGSSIPAMCVDNCLKNGIKKESFRDGKMCYVQKYDGIEVVTNTDGVVVTVTKFK